MLRVSEWRTVLLAGAILWTATACGSLGASERFEPTAHAIVLPAGENDYVLFDAGKITKVTDGEEEWSAIAEASAAQPSAAGFDLDAGWACVGYADQLAFVQLGGKRVRWSPAPTSGLHRSIAVRGELAAVNSGRVVSIVEVPSGTPIQSLNAGSWLKQFSQDEVDYAEPLSETELLLITSRDVGPLTDGKVLAIRAKRGPNGWLLQGESHLRAFTWADQCVSKGGDLYVAGIFETSVLEANRRQELLQTLVLLKVDTETLQVVELARKDHRPPTIVTDIAVGVDELAVLLSPGEVHVFSLPGGGVVHTERYPRADSIAWIGPRRWAVRAAGSSSILTY